MPVSGHGHGHGYGDGSESGKDRKNRVDGEHRVTYSDAMDTTEPHRDYDRIAQALEYLDGHSTEHPGLEAVARHVGVSPFHLQRIFSRWAGVSPKRFLQFLTVEHARSCLEGSMSVLEATFEVGPSSPGRLHDLTVAVDAVTPGELKSRGAGVTVRYGVHDSPFGRCLIGSTERGVCWLSFHDDVDAADGVESLRDDWANAELVPDSDGAARWRDRIFERINGGVPGPLPVLLAGTNFQLKVWRALLRVPPGELCSYAGLAAGIDRPTATRAVASAVAANRIAYLIPCHRVIRSMGVIGQYRWGSVRKRALIGWEQARRVGAAG